MYNKIHVIYYYTSIFKVPKRSRTLRFAEAEDSGKENKTTDDIEMFMREVDYE